MYSTAQRASLDVLHVQQNHKKQHRIQNSQRQLEAGAHAEQKPGTGNHQSTVTAMQTDESPQETLTHPLEAGGNQTSKTEAANAQPVDMDEEQQPEAGNLEILQEQAREQRMCYPPPWMRKNLSQPVKRHQLLKPVMTKTVLSLPAAPSRAQRTRRHSSGRDKSILVLLAY